MSAPQSQLHPQRVNFLDGVRGLAALMVLLEHVIKDFLAVVTPEKYDSILLLFITDGHFAVAIFFVLSGYVLSLSQVGSPKNLIYLFISRYFRLAIPIFLTCTITYLLLTAGLIFIAGPFYQFHPTIRGLLQFSLFDVFVHYDDLISYSPALWTISTELMGSYLLYLLIALFRKDTIYYLALPLMLATSLLFFKPFMACFIFGYLIFELNLRHSSNSSVLISRLGVLSFLSIVITASFVHGLDSWIKCLLASVLILSVCYSSMLKKVFTNPVLLFLGKISFILYLIQFSVICSLSAYIAIQFRDHNFVNLISTNLNLLATLAVTILCASLLNPLDRYSILISKRIGVQSNRLVGRFRSK